MQNTFFCEIIILALTFFPRENLLIAKNQCYFPREKDQCHFQKFRQFDRSFSKFKWFDEIFVNSANFVAKAIISTNFVMKLCWLIYMIVSFDWSWYWMCLFRNQCRNIIAPFVKWITNSHTLWKSHQKMITIFAEKQYFFCQINVFTKVKKSLCKGLISWTFWELLRFIILFQTMKIQNQHFSVKSTVLLKKLLKRWFHGKNVDFSIKTLIVFYSTFPHCGIRRGHSVEITELFCYSDLTWNHNW